MESKTDSADVAAPPSPGAQSWSVWRNAINPPHKKVVAIVPGIGAVPGKLVVSEDDSYSGDIDRKSHLIAAAPALLEALRKIEGGWVSADVVEAPDAEFIVALQKIARAAVSAATDSAATRTGGEG